jgi:hypothetical protein
MISIPEIREGATVLEAALAYAAAGIYVGWLPHRVKSPAASLGASWPFKTTTDPDVIRGWFTDHPERGVFIHAGRSGLVIVDVDKAHIVPVPAVLAKHLDSAPRQASRIDDPDRAHYIFAQPPGKTIGNSLGSLPGGWGDVRGNNGLVVAAPSAHKLDNGLYRWTRTGEVPVLPADVAEFLGEAAGYTEAATDSDVEAFIAEHDMSTKPGALTVRVRSLEAKLSTTGSRHDTLKEWLPGSMEEARAGLYPAQSVIDEFWPTFRDDVTADGSRSEYSAEDEFYRLVRWAVARAQLSDPEKVRERVQKVMPDSLFTNITANAKRDTQDSSSRNGDKPPRPALPKVSTTVLSTVKAEKVSWLWRGRLPKGKLVTLDGDPGLGKSTLAVELIAHITTGTDWPDDTTPEYTGSVVVFSAEDGLADTVRPRVDAAGGDATKVVAVIGVPTGYDDDGKLVIRPLTLGDTGAIEAAIVEHGAILAVVDVLMAFLPGATDSHRDQDVRAVLSQLSTIAERTGCTFLFIRHLTKGSGGGDPMYRGGGSIGIIGAARLGLAVARDPDDDERRVLAVVKSNLAKIAPSLAYRLEETPPLGVSRVIWDGEVSHTAADLLRNNDGGSQRPWSQVWLSVFLADGRRKSTDVKAAAEKAGIKERTLQAAAQKLGVLMPREGFPSVTYWELPTRAADPQHKRDCGTAQLDTDSDNESQSRSHAVAETLENLCVTDANAAVEETDTEYPLCSRGCGLPIGPVDIAKGRTHHGLCA